MALTRDDFIARLEHDFPEVAEAIDDSSCGILTLEKSELARASNAAIKSGEWRSLEAHFELAEEFLAKGDEGVKNAVNVAYLEHLPLYKDGHQYRKALAIMSPFLKSSWKSVHDYLDGLLGSE